MASSSSAIDNYDCYDVFLSFRGEDTRYNFISHLNDALCRNNIKAFIDDKIDRGDKITPTLERVIDGAKISIIVFSKKYAESTFCLDELARIMQCKDSKAQIVLPIFYKVDPSEATYEEAFMLHESNIKVEEWKSAFREALELAGWHIVENSIEAEIIGKITTEVTEKLNNKLPKGEELMCTSMVGEKAKDSFKQIWECLMDDKISRVGVYGMGGVGKTTIAARINDQLLATVNSFSRVFWVTVSKDFSICNMQSKIAKMMKLDISNEDEESKRAAKLRKRLKTEKFVLILDDVWEAFEIEDVGLPCLAGGQKLLLTSRNRRVCERMECLPIEVKPLYEKEALDLFIKESKYEINGSLQCWNIVASLVKECGGLPLAIVVIGRSMKGVKEIWKWRDTLRELRKPCEGENPEIEDKVYKVLKFSYDRLRNDRCRQCFLYCSLFPEDHEFNRDYLIEYWIGVGLLDEVDSRRTKLDKGNVILNEIIHASLLESGNFVGFEVIKMHDVIRDMAHMNLKVGLKLGSVQVLKTLNSFPNPTPHNSILKTLLLERFDILELSSCSFVKMESLTVLHISKMDHVKSILDCITNLENLRTLVIDKYRRLMCISLTESKESFTHNENLNKIVKGIERLINLRVLDLSFNGCIEVGVEALISLEKLEVLKVNFYNLRNLCCYIKSGHWQRLQEYHISYGEQTVPNEFKGECFKVMSFKAIWDFEERKGEIGLIFPYDIQYLYLVDWKSPMLHHFKYRNYINLQTLSIYDFNSRYLFTLDFAQHPLHNVQYLRIEKCYVLEEIIGREEEWLNPSNDKNYPTILLPNLKTLSLYFLPKLRRIYRGRMECPSLQLLEICACDKLERLPFSRGTIQNTRVNHIHGMKRWDCISEMWSDEDDYV